MLESCWELVIYGWKGKELGLELGGLAKEKGMGRKGKG